MLKLSKTELIRRLLEADDGAAVQAIITEALAQPSDRLSGHLVLALQDFEGRQIGFALVDSVQAGQEVWLRIASISGCLLSGFEILDDAGTSLYRGSYITDEC